MMTKPALPATAPRDQSGFLGAEARRGLVSLRTLIVLRWLAVAGQSFAVLAAQHLMDLRIDAGLCFLAIGACVISNLVAMFVYPQNTRLPEQEFMLTLLFDVTQLAFLIYLTGGLNNPFALLILAPVTVSAMTLRPRSTVILVVLACILVSVLTTYYKPLTTTGGTVLEMPRLFVFGFWIALMIGVAFLAIYTRRVAKETYAMSQALLATQMALAREQKLTDLGGVVAAAAHELGTPLATIKLASAELVDMVEAQSELQQDAVLIREQAERCSVILHSMGRAGKDDLVMRSAPLRAVLEEAAEPHGNRGKAILYSLEPIAEADVAMPVILRKPETIHGLRNLIQNGVDFARTTVWIDAQWTDAEISLRIIDDGPGYPADFLGRLGDPFLRRRIVQQLDVERPEYEGMGLGLFIAKTLLERSGGEITFANGSGKTRRGGSTGDRRGAIVEVIWDRNVIDARGSERLGENQPIPA